MPVPWMSWLLLALGWSAAVEAEPASAEFPAWSKLRHEVAALGVPPRPAPLEIRKGEIPVLTKNGRPEIADLQLTYEPAGPRSAPAPAALVLELTRTEGEAVAQQLGRSLSGSEPGAALHLRATGLQVLQLSDLQFTRPLGGDPGRLTEWQVAVTALVAQELSLVEVRAGQPDRVLAATPPRLLGGEYRALQFKTRKQTVKLENQDPKKQIVRLGLKPKKPRYLYASVSLLEPESGEEPSTLMVTAGRYQARFEIVPQDPEAALRPKRQPDEWAFQLRDGSRVPELFLPSQFHGQEGLGVFLRLRHHEKEPFRPRTRQASLEVLLVQVRLEGPSPR